MTSALRNICCIAILLGAIAPRAVAWGDRGHEIVALIAWPLLTPVTQQRVTKLLATDDSGLADSDIAAQSTWADKYRDSDRDAARIRYHQTFRWHFINLDLDRPNFDAACFGDIPLTGAASAGPDNECIVDKIDQFERELRDPHTDAHERLRALQFLLHLIGDLHQPLHASNHDDNGGTRVQVITGADRRMSMHSYWDGEVVGRLGRDANGIAANLTQQIGADEIARWQNGTTRDWAWEAWRIARGDIYRRLPEPLPDGSYRLDNAYKNRAREIARLQLQRAGVRLALVLNRSLDQASRNSESSK